MRGSVSTVSTKPSVKNKIQEEECHFEILCNVMTQIFLLACLMNGIGIGRKLDRLYGGRILLENFK